MSDNRTPNLKTIRQFTADYPAFTPGGLRSYIFLEERNGLKASGAIKRIGRKTLIDVDAFFNWIDSQNSK